MKWKKEQENTREKSEDLRKTCQTVPFIEESNRYKKRRTQANRLRGRRGWGRGAVVSVKVRRTNLASILVVVASYQEDLRSKVSEKGSLAYWREGQQSRAC